jgi:hypothetical protein
MGLLCIEHRYDGSQRKTNLYKLVEHPLPAQGATPLPAQGATPPRNTVPVTYKDEPSVESSDSAPSKSSATKKPPDGNMVFDVVAGEFREISESQFIEWESLFKKIDVMAEIEKAEAWLKANPRKRKKNYSRFLLNWFSRAADRAAQSKGQFVARPQA